jgi:ATP-dependent Clp protease ATP-binding subunit ClpA
MFERFTERARQVVVLGQHAALSYGHGYFGTEHVLLGLLMEAEGAAARVLNGLGITEELVRGEIEKIVGRGEGKGEGDEGPVGLPFTPRARKVLELALREALSLGHNYIGTEHVLLGIVREGEAVAFRILHDHGADTEKVREATMTLLMGERKKKPDAPAKPIPSPPLDPKKREAAVQIDAAAKLLTTLMANDYSGSVTVYFEARPPFMHEKVWPGVRVNVLWETMDSDEIATLISLGDLFGFDAEFSKQHGLTFRPRKSSLSAAIIEAGEPS